jgi:DNA-directed RNA polymerase subunit RPC12/RpoP
LIREFECVNCSAITERILTQAEDEALDVIPCKSCGSDAVKVEFSQTGGPIFKAGVGGFYKSSLGHLTS